MNAWFAYAIGRACAVANRPLCLFIASTFLLPKTAEDIAVVYLANMLGVVVIATDPHRRYYTRHFASQNKSHGLNFYLYFASLALTVGAGCFVVFAIGYHFTDSLLLGAAGVIYFVSEKLTDELQRLRIFERRLDVWGRTATWRCLLQLASFAVALAITGKETPAWLMAVMLSIGNVIVFVPQLPKGLARNLLQIRFKTFGWLARRSIRLLLASWSIWVTAQLTSGFSYLDRGVALVLNKAILPLFMLVVMCFAVVQLAVDFHYVSRYKRDFLEQQITIGAALRNVDFLVSLVGGFAAGAAACFAVLHFSPSGAEFPRIYVVVIAFLQLAIAVSTIPREILYWNQRLKSIMAVELLFWLLFACSALIAWSQSYSLTRIFGLVALCAGVRLILYVVFSMRPAVHEP
jgi:hypothetical protein